MAETATYEWFDIRMPGNLAMYASGYMDTAHFRPSVTELEAKRVMVEDKGWAPHIVVRGLPDAEEAHA